MLDSESTEEVKEDWITRMFKAAEQEGARSRDDNPSATKSNQAKPKAKAKGKAKAKAKG